MNKQTLADRSVKIDNKTYEKLKKIKAETGVPIRRIIKNAFKSD